MPDYAFWRRAVVNRKTEDVDPVVNAQFKISETDKIASAGSCFAQHIARILKENSFNFFITELPHPLINAVDLNKYNYGVYSARYGNIYTARQLLQLFDRAYGFFLPAENYWRSESGSYIDPFRPQIQPEGFASLNELDADRKQHFNCVKTMFENMDIFIFTLGLTECWLSKEDGAAYPVCPGVAGGSFDRKKYFFHNFNVEDTVNDLRKFIKKLKGINSGCRIILTVSPVPLVATAAGRHVLTSTTYSKSVLRVAADQITNLFNNVAYFPSYEIITGNFSRGRYFGEDLRAVTSEGVEHVMRLFLRHYAGREISTAPKKLHILSKLFHMASTSKKRQADSCFPKTNTYLNEMKHIVKVLCDEEALDIDS